MHNTRVVECVLCSGHRDGKLKKNTHGKADGKARKLEWGGGGGVLLRSCEGEKGINKIAYG